MRVQRRIKKDPEGFAIERKCPICGKIFSPAPFHAYRKAGRHQTLVCSYHCMLESERINEANKKKPGRPKKKP